MFSFLPTKLYGPPLPSQAVPRPQLLAQLNQGLAFGRNLTLVVAPAGFGKTTLVSQWLDDFRLPIADFGLHERVPPGRDNRKSKIVNPKCCWLSLDAYDNDLVRFLGYLAVAVQRVFPTACATTLSLVQAPQLPPVHLLAALLLQDLARLEQPCILTLEDYHVITEAAIHQLLARVLDHLPPSFHLILTSRTEPALPLARLRVRQRMNELRAADLCFSAAETQVFLTQALGKPPTLATVTALQTQTEGWVAGLQLAALSLRGRADEQAFVHAFQHSNRHVMEYLLEEVLATQPPAMQTFLLHTSILGRFCASLAEAVVGEAWGNGGEPPIAALPVPSPATGSAMLAYLAQTNLFVVPLDEQGEWYRYHHLFRELLRHHLQTRASAAEIAELHRRASAWLVVHGLIDEAVQQALAAGDDLAAAQLVEQHRHDVLNREAWRTLDRWLGLLPEALVRQRPALLLAQAWVLVSQFKLETIQVLLQAAEACLHSARLAEAEARIVRGEIATLWAYTWSWQNDNQRSLAAAQQALAQLPAHCLSARSVALYTIGITYHMLGQSNVGVQTLQAALAPHLAAPNTLAAHVLFTLALLHYRRGELTLMQQNAQALWQMAMGAKLAISRGWGDYLLGIAHYEWNALETAAEHFAALVDLRYSMSVHTVHNGWLALAWTYQGQGRLDQARQQVAALLAFHLEMNNLPFLPETYSFQARLALQQGDQAAAQRWAQTTHPPPAHELTPNLEAPWLTRTKVLLGQAGSPLGAASLAEASLILDRLQQVVETQAIPLRRIELLALQALVEARQGHTEQALTTLHRSIVLAEPDRFLRTFVDLGPALAGLLDQLVARGVEVDYLSQVLAAFPAPRPAPQIPQAAQLQPAQPAHRAALIEPLTDRELEHLPLLADRLSTKEIAQALTLSPATVRNHLSNIYQKLGVQDRKQAVAQARLLGLLP